MSRVPEVRLGCGHLVLYRNPPKPRDWVWCTRCDQGVQVAPRSAPEQIVDHEPLTITLPTRWPRSGRGRRRTRATDWAAGPAARVLLACTHVRWYRPPSPARGDRITCGCCGQPTMVLRPGAPHRSPRRAVVGSPAGRASVSPEPYYEDDLLTLYHGDALDVLPTIRSASIQAVVTDPPYVIGAVSAGNIGAKGGGWADVMNSALWFSTWYRQVDRVLHSSGSFWTFLNWRSVPVVLRAAIDAGLPVTSMAVWDKEWIGPGGSQGLRPSYELIALMAQPGFSIEDRGIPDVWRHKVGSFKPHGHPAEKPEGLVRRIVETAQLDQGQLVLDPFAGSGTTAAACRTLNLRCIAIEGEEPWCEAIARRCGQAVLDLGGTA